MQKIAIIGPGALGLAAQLQERQPSYLFIGLADEMRLSEPAPSLVDDYRDALSHRIEFDYKPTWAEAEWLQAQAGIRQRQEIWEDIVKQGPPVIKKWEREAKAADRRALLPRHCAQFTKSQPSPRARKAARKRAKAGRKASR